MNMLGVAKNLCYSTMLGIQMLSLPVMKERKTKPSEQKLGNTFCSQPDPDFE